MSSVKVRRTIQHVQRRKLSVLAGPGGFLPEVHPGAGHEAGHQGMDHEHKVVQHTCFDENLPSLIGSLIVKGS
jgi:hypothetical protein